MQTFQRVTYRFEGKIANLLHTFLIHSSVEYNMIWVNTFANFENAFYNRHTWWFLRTLHPHIGYFWMLINFGEGING